MLYYCLHMLMLRICWVLKLTGVIMLVRRARDHAEYMLLRC